MQIGSKIRDFRKERGLTLAQMAQKINVSPSYLSCVERNVKRPGIPMLKRISEALNISITYLLSDVPEGRTGERVQFFREARGLSLVDLAEISEIPIESLEAIEKGMAIPDLNQLERIAKALNITIRYFLEPDNGITKLGTKIRAARQKQGLSVSALAERAGVSPGLISQIENNQTTPLLDTLERIAKALGTSLSYFFLGQENVSELLGSLTPEVLEALTDPNVQSVLRAVRDLTSGELNYVLRFINFFKENRNLI